MLGYFQFVPGEILNTTARWRRESPRLHFPAACGSPVVGGAWGAFSISWKEAARSSGEADGLWVWGEDSEGGVIGHFP